DDPLTTYSHAARELDTRKLAYLHLVNPAAASLEKKTPADPRAMEMLQRMREAWRGILVLAGGFDAESAERWLREGRADLIAFGRKVLANPHLPERLRAGGSAAEGAERGLREGRADLIAFGRKFLANPDLPERLRAGAALNTDDP